MSIIPEKKEEFDASPSLVEFDKKRRKEKQSVAGFQIGLNSTQTGTMTRMEKIKQQQRELMFNLQKINEIQDNSKVKDEQDAQSD